MKFLYITIQRESGLNNVLYLYGRNKRGKYRFVIDDFYPYFFILANEMQKIESLKRCELNHPSEHDYLKFVDSIRNIRNGFKSLYDEPLVRIEMQAPWQVAKFRSFFSKTYEADIIFERRFLIDTGIKKGFEIKSSNITDNMRVSYKSIRGY